MGNIDEFRIGTVLSKSWEIFRQNIVTFGGVSVVLLAIPVILMMGLVMPALLGNPASMISSGMMWKAQIPTLVQMAFQLILMGAITAGTFQALEGRQASIGELAGQGLSNILPLLGIIVIAILVMIPSALLLFIPMIILACVWWVCVPAAVIEKTGVFGAFKRSAELTKGARMKIFGLLVIYIVFSMVVSALIGMFLLAGAGGLAGIQQRSLEMLTGGFSAMMIVSQIFSALLFAFICVVVAVCYYELRRIKEGTSIKDIANVFN